MRKGIVGVVIVAVLAIGAWFVFGRGGGLTATLAPGDADAPLAFAPADTPYVFANLEPMPKDRLDAWLKQSDAALGMYRLQYDVATKSLAETDPDGAPLKWLRALEAEFRGKTLQQSLQTLGVDIGGRSAVYGIGMVPVVRLSLADPAAFRAFVGRVETAAAQKIPAAKLGDIDYWQFTDGKAPLRGVLALQDKHLVLTLAPLADDSALRTLLGVDKPTASLGDGKALAALNAKYGYLPYASGYVDTTRLVAQFTAPPTALETAFLAALEIQKPTVDAVCQAEYAALAQAAPRWAIGYTTLEAKESVAVSRIELRGDLAQDLMTLRAPMPGLAAGGESLFNVGLSLKLGQLPALVGKWAGAVQSAPWKCPSLLDLNTAFAEAGTQINNPGVFAAAPVFEGLHVILTRFTVPQAGEEPDFAGKLLIGSPNPTALLGMAQTFAPQVATLGLKPDGEVKPLPPMEGVPVTLPTHVAMTDKLLGLAVGAGEEATLKQAMTVDAARQPLLVVGYSGAAFTQFADQMESTLLATEQDPAKQEEARRSVQMMKQIYGMIRRIDLEVGFDDTGVVITSAAEMN